MTEQNVAGTIEASIASRDIFGYLEYLPPYSLLQLYSDEKRGHYACRAVLQRLPELARQYILRLAVCGGEFPKSHLDMWARGNTLGGSGGSGAGKAARLSALESQRSLDRMRAMQVILDDDKKKRDEDDIITSSIHNGNGVGNRGVVGNGGNGRDNKEGDGLVKLRKEFHIGIQKSMTSLQSAPWPEVSPEDVASQHASRVLKEGPNGKRLPPPPTLEELEVYTQKRWDSVLHFLVGSSVGGETGVEEPPAAVVHFLEKTGLMQEDPDFRPTRRGKFGGNPKEQAPLVITSKGYEFMLRDVSVQVWQFILQYFESLSMHKKCEEIRREALLFLICLSYCRVGGAYPSSSLSKDARILMRDFAHFGLVYVYKGAEKTMFYPTRVSVNLVAGAGGAGECGGSDSSIESMGPSAAATRALEAALSCPKPSTSHIAIIVQTNFQLCAYTTSELHVSMLGLFCEVSTFRRLPNVIFFRITRDSVKAAFRFGIEAHQILAFLKMHAHPKLRTGGQLLVPKNVEDQILLWERELRRVVMEEVWVYQCLSNDEFAAVKQYCVDNLAHAWSSEAKSKIYVRYGKAEQVMAFVRRWRARAAQRRQHAADDEGMAPLRRGKKR